MRGLLIKPEDRLLTRAAQDRVPAITPSCRTANVSERGSMKRRISPVCIGIGLVSFCLALVAISGASAALGEPGTAACLRAVKRGRRARHPGTQTRNAGPAKHREANVVAVPL